MDDGSDGLRVMGQHGSAWVGVADRGTNSIHLTHTHHREYDPSQGGLVWPKSRWLSTTQVKVAYGEQQDDGQHTQGDAVHWFGDLLGPNHTPEKGLQHTDACGLEAQPHHRKA